MSMNRHNQHKMRIGTAFSLIAILLSMGCATVQEGSDPVVVRVEQATKIAVDTIDAFLLSEYQNRAAFRMISQDVEKFANVLRREVPQAALSVRELTKVYKSTRTAENRANLMTALAVLQTAANEAARYLARFTNPSVTNTII